LQSAFHMKTTPRLSLKKSPKNQSIIPYNPSLQNLIDQKNAWANPIAATHSHKRWHQRGYLPHRDEPGLTQLVTIRLYDSMPHSRRGEWEAFLKLENARERRTKLESYLDRGAGECWLKQPEIAQCAENALRHFAGERYDLRAWVVMPNHLHILVKIQETPLDKLILSWKRFIARESNKILGREGAFWQREYWDTYMRTDEQTLKAVKYIENNPVKAKLVRKPDDWLWSSARFRDRYGKLIPQESTVL